MKVPFRDKYGEIRGKKIYDFRGEIFQFALRILAMHGPEIG